MSTDEPDVSDAPFSEVQCQWLWQQHGQLARMGPPLGMGEQPTASTSGGSAQDSSGEPKEIKGWSATIATPVKTVSGRQAFDEHYTFSPMNQRLTIRKEVIGLRRS